MPLENLRLNPHLLGVPLYVGGRPIELVQEEYGLRDVIKLASNENPLGPSPRAVAAFTETLANAHRYPGMGDLHLRERIAARTRTFDGAFPYTAENVLTGNGIGDILRMLCEAFAFDGGEAIMCRTTFPLYRILVQRFGGTNVEIPHRAYHLDLDAMAAAITPRTRLVFVCNPNNPTGTVVSRSHVREFLERVPPSVVVVFDESYAELVDDERYSNATEYIGRGDDRVIQLRGFSKVHGLANLRIGYAIGTRDMIEYLHHAQLVFNTGDPVFYAAMAALDDHAHVRRVRDLVHTEKHRLYERFAAMGMPYVETQTNFILLPNLPCPSREIEHDLLRRGIIVRETTRFGLPDAIRVSIGTPAENDRFLEAFATIVGAATRRATTA